MQHFSEADETTYEDVSTKSGNSLVVLESAVPHIKELYSRITASLNTWTQFFQIVYCDGVCIDRQDDLYFLKNICIDPSDHFCTISVFGSDLIFKVPFSQSVTMKIQKQNVSYIDLQSGMTSYFNSEVDLRVGGLPLKTFSEHGVHFVSCGNIELMADLYTISENYLEIVVPYTNRHIVLSPSDSTWNAAALALPQNCNLRIDSEDNIAIDISGEMYRVHKLYLVDSDLILEYATYANPKLIETKIWRIDYDTN